MHKGPGRCPLAALFPGEETQSHTSGGKGKENRGELEGRLQDKTIL